MDVYYVVALIVPTIAILFAGALFTLASFGKSRPTALIAWSFIGLAVAMLLQYFEPFGFGLSRFLANAVLMAGAVGVAAALIVRHGRRPPLVLFALISALALVGVAAGLVGQPDLRLRIYAANLGVAGIFGLLAIELARIGSRRTVDRFLLGASIALSLATLARPWLMEWLQGGYGSEEDFFRSLYWITVVLSAIVVLIVITFAMVASLGMEAISALHEQSVTDPLSGVLNRRGFEAEALRAMARARRAGLPLSIVLCDLDHFKQINDRYGHAAGDDAIVGFSGLLQETASSHLIGRLGGEEFAILTYGAGASSARLLAEGIRIALPQWPFDTSSGEQIRLAASFGVAQMEPQETLAALIGRADEALYEAKAAGRDRVRVSRPTNAVLHRRSSLT